MNRIPQYARGYESFPGTIGRTTATSTTAWAQENPPKAGSPNVIVIVVDDMGYSDIGPYGSEIPTPHLDAMAAEGVTFTNYHTAPLCSPARAALLTGVNPHRAGFGYVSNVDPGLPGMRIELGPSIPTLAEDLRASGYATFAIGKWHLVREGQMHAGADKGSWPCQRGFDHYYGSLEGLNSFFEPNQLVRDNTALPVREWPEGYYLTDDLTDEAVNHITSLRAAHQTKPFFLYFAHIALHAPLQAQDADIEVFKDRYAAGWDEVRRSRFARQLELGLFPPGTEQAPRHTEPGFDVPPWEDLTAEQQRRYARYMEVYAAMVASVDRSIGRLRDTLAELGELDNTIFVFTSDNGASAEGSRDGTRSYFRQFPFTFEQLGWQGDTALSDDEIGRRDSGPHYPRGWAQASNTPFRYYKGQTFAGGVRVPLIVSWPKGLPAGELRTEYGYVTDVAPTVLDLAGVQRLTHRQGVETVEADGVPLTGVLRSGEERSPHTTQYSEIAGHRGMYHDGWKLLSLFDRTGGVDEPDWQLFDMRSDPTELTDLAAEHPDLVRKLAERWDHEAWRNTVFPLIEATGPGAGVLPGRRPADQHMLEKTVIHAGTPTVERYRSLELIQYRDCRVDIRLEQYSPGDTGVLLSHGDILGGYVLYAEDGRFHLLYNAYGEPTRVSAEPVAQAQTVTLDFTTHGLLRWGVRILVDGNVVAELADVPQFVGMVPWTGITVGADWRGPVDRGLRARPAGGPYAGRVLHATYLPGEQTTPKELIQAVQAEMDARAD